MNGFEILDPRFAHYVLDNAPLEELATGFRWIEGLVWMGDADCLLFQDLPRDRTMRWIEGAGVSIYRAPSGYANGQARDRQGRLISCSHRERCLFRTELDGSVTRLIDRHDGKAAQRAQRRDRQIRRNNLVHRSALRNPERLRGRPPGHPSSHPRFIASTRKVGDIAVARRRLRRPEWIGLFTGRNAALCLGNRRSDDRQSQTIYSLFDVTPDGVLSGGDVFHKIEPGYADGLTMDEDGNVWSSAGDGVHCIGPGRKAAGKRSSFLIVCPISRSAVRTEQAFHRRFAHALCDIPQSARRPVAVRENLLAVQRSRLQPDNCRCARTLRLLRKCVRLPDRLKQSLSAARFERLMDVQGGALRTRDCIGRTDHRTSAIRSAWKALSPNGPRRPT
jgi:gluconolactonase